MVSSEVTNISAGSASSGTLTASPPPVGGTTDITVFGSV